MKQIINIERADEATIKKLIEMGIIYIGDDDMLFFFNALMEEYGFGKERLTRVKEYMLNLLSEYQENKECVKKWSKELYQDAGVLVEMPVDPLTQTAGSIMTGY